MEILQSLIHKMLKNKKGQTWYVDLIIGLVIFLFVLILYFNSEVNIKNDYKEKIDDMQFEGDMITNLFMSKGYPENWNSTSYKQIGIVEDASLDLIKLEELRKISYISIKSNIGTKYDFYFYFRGEFGIMPLFVNTTETKEGFGYATINSTNLKDKLDPNHIIVINRYVVFKENLGELKFILWSN